MLATRSPISSSMSPADFAFPSLPSPSKSQANPSLGESPPPTCHGPINFRWRGHSRPISEAMQLQRSRTYRLQSKYHDERPSNFRRRPRISLQSKRR
ncbi:hypothetical protein NL676_005697 [Syzygium grande]|nr:hypothetical protein NL676_005697 [Syzygium grande]